MMFGFGKREPQISEAQYRKDVYSTIADRAKPRISVEQVTSNENASLRSDPFSFDSLSVLDLQSTIGGKLDIHFPEDLHADTATPKLIADAVIAVLNKQKRVSVATETAVSATPTR